MIRKLLFWIHLLVGLAVGIVVLIMSATGVMLAFELQILDWARPDLPGGEPSPTAEVMPVEALLVAGAEAVDSGGRAQSITFSSDPRDPVDISYGRRQSVSLDPYTGQPLAEGSTAWRDFFRWSMGWHRWLGREGDGRQIGKAITGISNLAFLFLILSGLYLWWPKKLRWSSFRPVLWFTKNKSSKLRDWNWHNVLGFWTALPLAFLVATATFFNYEFPGKWLAAVVGEDEPVAFEAPAVATALPGGPLAGIDDAVAGLKASQDDWNRLSVSLPTSADQPLEVSVDRGNGRQPQKRETLFVDRATGEILATRGFGDQSTYRQARTVVRFGHTGEMFGLPGQIIAAGASFAGCVLVYTGIALAFRRLVLRPLRRRERGDVVEAV